MKNIAFIDSHAHLALYTNCSRTEIVQRAKKQKVLGIVDICLNKKALEEGKEFSKKNPEVALAAALSPHDVGSDAQEFLAAIEKAAKEKKIVAIGELGLDYFYIPHDKVLQKKFFEFQLSLAFKHSLPLLFHCRNAFEDLFMITGSYPNKCAALHCFTGTMKEAEEALKRGWFLSFSGILTFPKSHALREVAKEVPLSQIIIETDAPFLAPQAFRGKTNEPSFLPEIAKTLAEIKGISLEEIAAKTSQNTQTLLRYPFDAFAEDLTALPSS